MKVSAEIVVQSHLSDACIELDTNIKWDSNTKLAEHRIRFVKYLVDILEGNLQQQIDSDELYRDFIKTLS